MREDRDNRNNSGFTLVEVMIAVAILAVVSIPIIQSFVSVAQVNSKSRRRLSSATIAENLMESCKGTSLLEVGAQCNLLAPMTIVSGDAYESGVTTAQELSFKETEAEGVYELDDATPSPKTVAYDSGYKLTMPSDRECDKCAFWIKKIKSGGAYYDAVVIYEYDSDRAKDTGDDITQMEDNGIHVMRFYKVTINVYRSSSTFEGLVDELATISGSVTDYSE